jgi:hypothetical protein
MSRPLRVVHLPARTPYVRKITSPDYTVTNGTATRHGVVPATVTAAWILDRRPLDWLDVLHLHHVESEDITALRCLLAACAETGVRIVYTAHDLTPMVTTTADFAARLQIIAESPEAWIGLTAASIQALQNQVPGLPAVTHIPHGYVISPDTLTGKNRTETGSAPRYLLYGALRTSRDHLSTIANWTISMTDPKARFTLVLRGLSPADMTQHNVPALLAMTRSDLRIQTLMRAYPDDQEIVDAGLHADALLLPYLSGSHSGQLELAFDLNLLPVCSSVGYLKDQYRLHEGLVSEPEWFDWADGRPFLYGERFVAALEAADLRLAQSRRHLLNDDFLEHRRNEHANFLETYAAVYSA